MIYFSPGIGTYIGRKLDWKLTTKNDHSSCLYFTAKSIAYEGISQMWLKELRTMYSVNVNMDWIFIDFVGDSTLARVYSVDDDDYNYDNDEKVRFLGEFDALDDFWEEDGDDDDDYTFSADVTNWSRCNGTSRDGTGNQGNGKT